MDSCSNVFQFLENKTIFVTGATGFLAKVFVEKILRIQPNIKKLYLLVRASNVNSATQRLEEEVLKKDLFRLLKEKLGANVDSFFYEKIAPVPGDTSCDNLGVLDFALRDEIWRNTDIVVNCAATTNFDERYDVAFSVNTMGPLNILNFAKKCSRIKMLLHVSTAYVCGEGNGLIMEKPFCMGEVLKGTSRLDINVEKKMVDDKMNQLLSQQDAKATEIASAMKDFGLERARLYGWPNTYAFTKAMGEMILGQFRDNLSLAILRPTIITSTFKEPFPGYIEGLRTLDSFVAIIGKGRTNCILANAETILDAIPVDMVVSSMIMAMLAHTNQYSENLKIYQIGSSFKNPLTISNTIDFIFTYFTKKPLKDTMGQSIEVTKPKLLSNRVQFLIYIKLKYILPLKVFGLVNAVFWQNSITHENSHRKIELAMRLAELYEPYVLFKGIFDVTNTESLEILATRNNGLNGIEFNLDPKCINWEDYFLNIHIPGLLKYVMK